MGLGDGPSWRDEYEWVRLADLPAPRARRARAAGADDEAAPAATRGRGRRRAAPAPPPDDDAVAPYADAMVSWFRTAPLWVQGAGARVLLVDLDNLRAGPVRWRARMAGVVELARSADHVALAGQAGAVERARPWLEEFADAAEAVAAGPDAADLALIAAADHVGEEWVQFVVVSNDHIFARLSERGALTLLSPSAAELSGRLREAAWRVVDLAGLEREAEAAALADAEADAVVGADAADA